MRTDVAVTQERLIAAGPEAVWRVIADPALHERLDERVRLEARSGEDGRPGSAYEVSVRVAPLVTVRLEHAVVEAVPGSRLVAHLSLRGARYGEQRAELTGGPDGTLLRWTVVRSVGPVAATATAGAITERLASWLDGVEREALAR